ncbi:MAG: 30S ribosomal protein S12 methylthiotransferase RimO [Clostridia bacterium]|nr:30S ribosomal protein S12 methylthiotransferase RimO [Clostridia bacterium]
MNKTKIGFISLGCPKNRVDTEIMLHHLADAGYEIVGEDVEADVIIVNTCAFIRSAKEESIDNILDAAYLKKHGKLKGIIVCGCMAERYRSEIFESFPDEVDAVVGTGSIHDIVAAVKAVETGGKGYCAYGSMSELDLDGERIVTTAPHTAYIKISEGCDNRCTYCAIPYIRGPFRSRTVESVVAEAKDLEKIGVKELILIAQDTTRYGEDIYGEYSLVRLIREICAQTAIPWLRLLYCYPDKITGELVAELRDNPRLLKYIDIPIQHISEPVLKRMNRRGGAEAVRRSIAALRENVPDIIIRTTLISGFPGETEEDFEELCEYVAETKFDRLGVFPYSREEGTPAYSMPDQVDEQVKQDRADAIMRIQADITAAKNAAKIGRTYKVICEGYDVVAETWYGRSYMDAPDIDGLIFFSSEKKLAEGELVDVTITDADDYDLFGRAAGCRSRMTDEQNND